MMIYFPMSYEKNYYNWLMYIKVVASQRCELFGDTMYTCSSSCLLVKIHIVVQRTIKIIADLWFQKKSGNINYEPIILWRAHS